MNFSGSITSDQATALPTAGEINSPPNTGAAANIIANHSADHKKARPSESCVYYGVQLPRDAREKEG